MKRVLVIANLYHASPRVPGLATHLRDYGWKATVVTPPVVGKDAFGFPDRFAKNVEILETKDVGDIWQLWRNALQKLNYSVKESGYQSSLVAQVKRRMGITGRRSIIEWMMDFYRLLVFAFPDDERKWKRVALEVAEGALRTKKFDVILSSSPYGTSHWVASKLRAKHGIPWVADFRDPWSQNHYYPHGRLRRFVDTTIEKRVIANADLLIAATPEVARKQSALHAKETLVITNGFEKMPGGGVFEPGASPKLTVVYTGGIYRGKQDPEKLFSALAGLFAEGEMDAGDWRIDFYGPETFPLRELIAKYNLAGIVREVGPVPRDVAFARQRSADLLLLFNWDDRGEKGIYPTKFFEYLSAGRPILATGGYDGDDIHKMLSDTKTGVYAMSKSAIKGALLSFYREFKAKGRLSYGGDLAEIGKYSYGSIARKLSAVLQRVAQSGSSVSEKPFAKGLMRKWVERPGKTPGL